MTEGFLEVAARIMYWAAGISFGCYLIVATLWPLLRRVRGGPHSDPSPRFLLWLSRWGIPLILFSAVSFLSAIALDIADHRAKLAREEQEEWEQAERFARGPIPPEPQGLESFDARNEWQKTYGLADMLQRIRRGRLSR